MVNLFGKKLAEHKPIKHSLNKLFGISNSSINLVCQQLGFNSSIKLKLLDKRHIRKLQKFIENKLDFEQTLKIKLLKQREKLTNIRLTRSIRFIQGYPVRGQRTHSNCARLKRKNQKLRKKLNIKSRKPVRKK
jgi:ribosomal protein S13